MVHTLQCKLTDSSLFFHSFWIFRYDDSIFSNVAKKEEPKKRFINDHIRSDFHKSFMKRYFR